MDKERRDFLKACVLLAGVGGLLVLTKKCIVDDGEPKNAGFGTVNPSVVTGLSNGSETSTALAIETASAETASPQVFIDYDVIKSSVRALELANFSISDSTLRASKGMSTIMMIWQYWPT